jgi:hypothetical protein
MIKDGSESTLLDQSREWRNKEQAYFSSVQWSLTSENLQGNDLDVQDLQR